MNLFEQLNEAISKGNIDEIDNIQRKILSSGRDLSIDESFINNIKGKTLYRTLVKSINENSEMSKPDYMKLVTSLLTHNIIESCVTGKDMKNYPIKELYIILGNFISEKEEAVDEYKRFIQDRYSQFI